MLRRKPLLVACAAITIWALIQSPSAQISGSIGGDFAPKSSTGAGVPVEMAPPATTGAAGSADRKAAAAMTNESTTTLTSADKKAADAMAIK